jgi:hypothetical protein
MLGEGMNMPGGTRPRAGCSQRISASTALMFEECSDTFGW